MFRECIGIFVQWEVAETVTRTVPAQFRKQRRTVQNEGCQTRIHRQHGLIAACKPIRQRQLADIQYHPDFIWWRWAGRQPWISQTYRQTAHYMCIWGISACQRFRLWLHVLLLQWQTSWQTVVLSGREGVQRGWKWPHSSDWWQGED